MAKDIYVFAEQRDGKIQKVTYELLGVAKELSKKLDQKVVGVVLGYQIIEPAKVLFQYGADEVIVMDDEVLKNYMTEHYVKALYTLFSERKPEIVLYGATSIGRDLAPCVSARIHTGLTADCTDLKIDEESKNLLMTRPAFGGNIMATIICPDYRPQMATVRPGVMKPLKQEQVTVKEVEQYQVSFDKNYDKIVIKSIEKSTKKAIDITGAKVLVSGGRGIGGKEGFESLAKLANVMKGEISSSRACVDAGWIPRNHQVGQTGSTVSPDLYVAAGISGAIQHIVGMEKAETIIAINKDETAPIFDVADVGIVGDANTIIPRLTEALENI